MYAKAFEDLNFDSVTVVRTWKRFSGVFLAFENKHTIMLALTSNEGALISNVVCRRKRIIHVLETSKPGRIQRT
jgi:orotidine-5'-phosphate decarboxylase